MFTNFGPLANLLRIAVRNLIAKGFAECDCTKLNFICKKKKRKKRGVVDVFEDFAKYLLNALSYSHQTFNNCSCKIRIFHFTPTKCRVFFSLVCDDLRKMLIFCQIEFISLLVTNSHKLKNAKGVVIFCPFLNTYIFEICEINKTYWFQEHSTTKCRFIIALVL